MFSLLPGCSELSRFTLTSRIAVAGLSVLTLAVPDESDAGEADLPPETPASAAAVQPESVPATSKPPLTWPTLPFAAWVGVETVYVRSLPRVPAALSGVLKLGDTVQVTGCKPDCANPKAWALLGESGAVKLAVLRLGPVPKAARDMSSVAQYHWGKVPRPATRVFAAPSLKSNVLRKEKAEFRLAFVPDEALFSLGWLQRPDGGFMRAKDVVLFQPSRYVGAHFDHGPPSTGVLAFVRRKTRLQPLRPDLPGVKTPPVFVNRYDRFEVEALRGSRVQVPGGWLPRNRVRIAHGQKRPKEVKPIDKWLHIDLAEQVLTAYEGDRMVFATLVSTGKTDRRSTKTPAGTFKVYAKTVHSSMRGKPWDDYYAEEIPHVLHFDGGRAIHGTYWHDQFGIQKSHGCINLSLADVKWVFDWAPPAKPDGWHSVMPFGKQAAAWVVVEKSGGRIRLQTPGLAQGKAAGPNLAAEGGVPQPPDLSSLPVDAGATGR